MLKLLNLETLIIYIHTKYTHRLDIKMKMDQKIGAGRNDGVKNAVLSSVNVILIKRKLGTRGGASDQSEVEKVERERER